MTDTRLIEREAENQVDEEYIKNDNTEMVVEFNINNSNSNTTEVEYKNLDGEWKSLCSLQKLISEDVSDIFENSNVTSSATILSELNCLQNQLQECWNQKYEMYKLSYRKNDDGSSELYIPIKTAYTDDIIVQKIYTSDDNFVAGNVEDNIKYPLYELESKDLYIENITEDNQNVYKLEQKEFDEYVDYHMNYNNRLEAKEGVIFSTIGTIGLYSIYYYVWQVYSIDHAMVLFCISLAIFGLPILLPLSSIYSVFVYIIAYLKCVRFSNMNTVKTFETVK